MCHSILVLKHLTVVFIKIRKRTNIDLSSFSFQILENAIIGFLKNSILISLSSFHFALFSPVCLQLRKLMVHVISEEINSISRWVNINSGRLYFLGLQNHCRW